MAKRTASTGWGSIGIDPVTIRGEIFDYFVERGERGATCDEVEYRLALPHQTASARISELVTSRVLVDTGERRSTSHGRKARVYRVSRSCKVREPKTAKRVPEHAAAAWR